MEEKNLQLDRMVFFCDAVVAIAITLLVFNIKIDHPVKDKLTFRDIASEWRIFAAFFLSFINIANFWKTHHFFFSHICKIDEKLLWFNISWLFFIILLPFSTSLVSAYFADVPAMTVYCLNTFFVACFQNLIWDYVAVRPDFLKKDAINDFTIWQFRLFCNLGMINSGLAFLVAFWKPSLAFIILFTKFPAILGARLLYGKKFREEYLRNRKPKA